MIWRQNLGEASLFKRDCTNIFCWIQKVAWIDPFFLAKRTRYHTVMPHPHNWQAAGHELWWLHGWFRFRCTWLTNIDGNKQCTCETQKNRGLGSARHKVLEYNKKEEAQQQNERYIYNHGNWYKGDITTYWESRQQVCNEGRYSRIHSDISPEEYSGGVYLSAVGGLISPRSGLGQVQRKLAHFCFDIQREPISNQTLLLIFTIDYHL